MDIIRNKTEKHRKVRISPLHGFQIEETFAHQFLNAQKIQMKIAEYVDTKMIVSGVIFLAVVLLLWYLWNKFMSNSSSSITAEKYGTLTDDEKKKYKLNSSTGKYDLV